MASADNATNGMKMTAEGELNFEAMKDAVQVRHGIYMLLSSVLFFQFVNWIVKSQGPPKSLKCDEWKWRNLYVSWIHASICSAWVILSLIFYPELLQDLTLHVNYFTYFLVCFVTGYFIYDFLDLIVNNMCLKMWEVQLHHVSIVGIFFYNVAIKTFIAFNVITLTIEINSFFLHWRKLMQVVSTPYDSAKYIVIKYLNLITFLVFRGAMLTVISIAVYYWRYKVTLFYYLSICLSMLVMNILNPILFWRLFKSDVLRGEGGKGRSSVCATVKRDCDSMNRVREEHQNGYLLLGSNNNLADSSASKKTE